MIKKLKTIIKPFLHFKFLISFGLAWIITNGWCYLAFGLAVWLNIGWLKAVAGSYMAFLYLPFTFTQDISCAIKYHKMGFHSTTPEMESKIQRAILNGDEVEEEKKEE